MALHLTEEEKRLILRRYQEGIPLRQIGREIGRPDITVRRTLEAQGVVFGPPKTSNRRSSAETEAVVLRLYDAGATWDVIKDQAAVTSTTISKILKRNGRSFDRKPESAGNQTEIVKALYEGGHSTRKIGSLLGRSKSTINRVLMNSEMEIRRNTGCGRPNFFDVIDTEEKAYWLGFITADGCVVTTSRNPEGSHIAVRLAIQDRGHLAKLKDAVSASSSVTTGISNSFGKPRGSANLSVYSSQLVSALAEHGVGPRKSASAKPWRGRSDLMRHYWRGLVDGDGSLPRKSAGAYTVVLCGSEACVRGFAAWAADICGTKATPYFRTGCWYVGVSGRHQVPKLIRELYGDATVSLDRKQEIANRILDIS